MRSWGHLPASHSTYHQCRVGLRQNDAEWWCWGGCCCCCWGWGWGWNWEEARGWWWWQGPKRTRIINDHGHGHSHGPPLDRTCWLRPGLALSLHWRRRLGCRTTGLHTRIPYEATQRDAEQLSSSRGSIKCRAFGVHGRGIDVGHGRTVDAEPVESWSEWVGWNIYRGTTAGLPRDYRGLPRGYRRLTAGLPR